MVGNPPVIFWLAAKIWHKGHTVFDLISGQSAKKYFLFFWVLFFKFRPNKWTLNVRARSKNGGCPLVRACSLIRSNTVVVHLFALLVLTLLDWATGTTTNYPCDVPSRVRDALQCPVPYGKKRKNKMFYLSGICRNATVFDVSFPVRPRSPSCVVPGAGCCTNTTTRTAAHCTGRPNSGEHLHRSRLYV